LPEDLDFNDDDDDTKDLLVAARKRRSILDKLSDVDDDEEEEEKRREIEEEDDNFNDSDEQLENFLALLEMERLAENGQLDDDQVEVDEEALPRRERKKRRYDNVYQFQDRSYPQNQGYPDYGHGLYSSSPNRNSYVGDFGGGVGDGVGRDSGVYAVRVNNDQQRRPNNAYGAHLSSPYDAGGQQVYYAKPGIYENPNLVATKQVLNQLRKQKRNKRCAIQVPHRTILRLDRHHPNLWLIQIPTLPTMCQTVTLT
jgi:hypothetical protein